MINILMIEDDPEIADLLFQVLLQHNMLLDNYECPELGLSALSINNYDAVILDLSLPGLDGTQVCKIIREKSDIPIIISSARSDIQDKTICFNHGADDYIPKPYDVQELVLRLKALLKRSSYQTVDEEENKPCLFTYDDKKLEVYKEGELIELTMAEYHILAYFIKRSGFPVSRQEILLNVDSIKYESNIKSIDVLIGRIRQKIEENSKKPAYLVSIRGVGYKFINE